MRHVFFAEELRAHSEVKLLVFQFSDFVPRPTPAVVAASSPNTAAIEHGVTVVPSHEGPAAAASAAGPDTSGSATPQQHASGAPSHLASSHASAALYHTIPEVQEGFWKSVANEALTPFLSYVRSITPFDIATRGSVVMIVSTAQQVITSSPQSTDTFLIHGGDESGLYHVHGSPFPIPRLMLPRTTWNVGSVLFHVELPQWSHSNPSLFASVNTVQQNPTERDDNNNISANDEMELRELDQVPSAAMDLQLSPSRTIVPPRGDHTVEEWLETVLLADYLGQSRESNPFDLITAYNTAVNSSHLNRMHASLLWACEGAVIEAFNYEQHLGSDTALVKSLRRSIAHLTSLAVDYCSRAQIVVESDKKARLMLIRGSVAQRERARNHLDPDTPFLQLTESFSPTELARTNSSGFTEFAPEFRGTDVAASAAHRDTTLDNTAIIRLIAQLRVDVCSWSSPMFATPESPEFALAISRRVTKYLVDFAHATLAVVVTSASPELDASQQQQEQ